MSARSSFTQEPFLPGRRRRSHVCRVGHPPLSDRFFGRPAPHASWSFSPRGRALRRAQILSQCRDSKKFSKVLSICSRYSRTSLRTLHCPQYRWASRQLRRAWRNPPQLRQRMEVSTSRGEVNVPNFLIERPCLPVCKWLLFQLIERAICIRFRFLSRCIHHPFITEKRRRSWPTQKCSTP